MSTKKQKLTNKENFARQQTEEGTLTGTALASVTIFLQETHALTSTGSTFTIDSNAETTRQILEKHVDRFSEAWKALADK